ncbi:EVE domain-containing protein [Acidithiobacillus sp. IBUN Pt1247-S3]|uniref:EVE domain-containing protein n=1 Tax=Acidithiobacillus sp. IBUN Pt1247-S3 TaxID=3166642 RepID=UPI0034E4ABCA
MKTEPEAFSLDDLAERGQEPWDGIRNYQARNFMRSMTPGDGVFIYHSRVLIPGIVGVADVRTSAHPDPTQFDSSCKYYDPNSKAETPRWDLVDVGFRGRLTSVVSLDELRRMSVFSDSPLIRKGNRLSILPITEAQWTAVLERVELV